MGLHSYLIIGWLLFIPVQCYWGFADHVHFTSWHTLSIYTYSNLLSKLAKTQIGSFSDPCFSSTACQYCPSEAMSPATQPTGLRLFPGALLEEGGHNWVACVCTRNQGWLFTWQRDPPPPAQKGYVTPTYLWSIAVIYCGVTVTQKRREPGLFHSHQRSPLHFLLLPRPLASAAWI